MIIEIGIVLHQRDELEGDVKMYIYLTKKTRI